MNQSETEKLYCYIDESGQDTRGRLFVVSVVIVKDDRDELSVHLDQIERETGKKGTKWLKTSRVKKVAYIECVFKDKRFRNKIFYAHLVGAESYSSATLETIFVAIQRAKSQEKYKAAIFIDGLSRSSWRRTGAQLRRMGVKTEKVRGVKDENHSLIRLADAIAGLAREKVEGVRFAQDLYNIGIDLGTLAKLE